MMLSVGLTFSNTTDTNNLTTKGHILSIIRNKNATIGVGTVKQKQT